MPYIDRADEEIVIAYEEWAEWHPKSDEPCLSIGRESYSPRGIARVLRECLENGNLEETLYRIFVIHAKDLSREHDEDVVARIRLPIEASDTKED